MRVGRRDFLKRGALGMSALLLPTGLARRARAATDDHVLVVVYLRGGADGLNIVVPRGDPDYAALRPDIAVPEGNQLDLGGSGFFGLHPAFTPLHPIYQSGGLAFIHASGSHDPSRSHFDAQDFMERGAPGNKSVSDGWLSRTLMKTGSGQPIQGITLDKTKVKAIAGAAPSIAFRSISQFELDGQYVVERRNALEGRYQGLAGAVGGAVQDAFAVLDTVAAVDTTTATVYPTPSAIAPGLADAAALIKAQLGVKVICLNIGGWDHHSDIDTRMDDVGGDLAASLAAFWDDLGPGFQGTTTTLCVTEFGRRPGQNGGGGCDHGHGGIMLAMGGGVAGGQVLLRDQMWPGLAPTDLYNGQDLAVTTDFRDAFAEVIDRFLGLTDTSGVFPGYNPGSSDYPGLFV